MIFTIDEIEDILQAQTDELAGVLDPQTQVSNQALNTDREYLLEYARHRDLSVVAWVLLRHSAAFKKMLEVLDTHEEVGENTYCETIQRAFRLAATAFTGQADIDLVDEDALRRTYQIFAPARQAYEAWIAKRAVLDVIKKASGKTNV